MTIKNQEALEGRAQALKLKTFNGIKLVLVELQPDPDPTEAILTVHFHNNNEIQNILDDVAAGPIQAKDIFPISGGHRIPAGPLSEQVQAVGVSKGPDDEAVLCLTVRPIGDYSTYTLSIDYPKFDPILSQIDFKFRPGCFNYCAPDWERPPEPKQDPPIDYLAKDYDSFRHTLIAWMANRVPGWQPTSEADLDQVLLELFSAAADQLSYFQDRVMHEACLGTARKRVSLARHARLMDYHIHQGNQASTCLALRVNSPLTVNKGLRVGTGHDLDDPASVVFVTRHEQDAHPLLNDMSLHTWSDAIPALAAGTTRADLKLSTSGRKSAMTVQKLIRDGKVTRLLIQERLNPLTGERRGRDPSRRQLLKLLPGNEGAEAKHDPVEDQWFVRVRWEAQDSLKRNYCFTVDCDDGKVGDVSRFHGNLVEVCHGRPKRVIFKEEEKPLASPSAPTDPEERHYQRKKEGTRRGEVICELPDGPLAYRDSLPGGEVPPESTLEVKVEVGGLSDPWNERISLIHSDDSDEGGDHFVVETDEKGRSWIRFGDGTNGKKLPQGAAVRCVYQVGRGLDGNVGADTLRTIESGPPGVDECWNPFDVANGRDPEPVAQIIRRVPEAYRYRQLRAVTENDYEDRAEEIPGVARASARYVWTGSWRTVRITVDPVGTTVLTEELGERVARHLEAVRLIGEDLEIRPPRSVPLDIVVRLCIDADYWPEHIREVLEQEFSDGYTPDGRMAFFHPDRWTFGQALRTSQIVGAVQSIKGVDHVIETSMRRWSAATPGISDVIEVQPNEIIQVESDPDHKEWGFITFELKGGRQ